MVEAWGGPTLAGHARSAISKIALALPKARQEEVEQTPLFALSFHIGPGANAGLENVRKAILEHRKLRIEYKDSAQQVSRRAIWPLAVYFWGTTWSIAAWCETRNDFRNFRLDRIGSLEILADVFMDTPGRRLEDFVAKMDAEGSR